MATVSELEVVLRGDDGDLDDALARGEEGVDNFSRNASRHLGNLARDVAAFAGAMAVALTGAAIGVAIEWESSFANVEKTVEGTDEELAELEATLRNLATDGVTSSLDDAHTSLAGIAAAAGSLGIATEDIAEFTETVAIMSVATGMGAEELATWAARFANVTGMDMGNLGLLSDTLVTLENNMAATADEITQFSSRMASLATFNFEPQEILAYSAAMASLGLTAELGSTNFVKSVSDMTTAVAENGPQLAIWADTAGMTADEFRALAQSDGEGAFLAFLEGLKDLPVEEQIQRLNDLGITSQEQQRTIMTLAAGYDTVTESLDHANAGWAGNNAAMTEATAQADTTQGSINRMENSLRDAGITLGDHFLPAVSDVAEGMADWLGGNQAVGIEKMKDGLLGLADAVGQIAFSDEDFDFQNTLDQWSFVGDALSAVTQDILQEVRLFFLDLKYDFLFGATSILESTNVGGVNDAQIQANREEMGRIVEIEWDINAAQQLEDDINAQLASGFEIDLGGYITFESGGESVTLPTMDLLLDPNFVAELDPFALEALQTQVAADLEAAMLAGDEEAVEMNLQVAANLGMDTTQLQADVGAEIEQSLADAYATGDQEAIDTLVPIAIELGIDTEAVRASAEVQVVDAIEAQTYPAIAYVDLVIIPSSVDDSAITAAANGSTGTGSSSNVIVVNNYGNTPYETVAAIDSSNQAAGPS